MKLRDTFKKNMGRILIAVIFLLVAGMFRSANGQTTETTASAKTEQPAQAADSSTPKTQSQTSTNAFVLPKFSLGLNHLPLMKTEFLPEQPLWQPLAALLYIILAYYVSKALNYLICSRVKAWAAKTKTNIDYLLQLLQGPIKVMSVVILLHFGLELSPFLSNALKVVVAISLTYLATKCIDMLIALWKQRASAGALDKSFDEMLFPVVNKSLKIFLVVVAILLTSDNLGINIKTVLASLSIGGLALGLAAQDTIANVFGAVSIFMDRPFRIGDFVRLEGVEGVIESIGLRSTRIRNPDGFLITVPNKIMGNATITNVSSRPTIKTLTMIGLVYDTSADKVKRALRVLEEIHRCHPVTHDVLITFKEFADSSLNLQVIHWSKAKDFKEQMVVLQDLNLAVKQRFDEEGIEFAFPSRTLYVKHDGAPANVQPDGNGSPSVALPDRSLK